MGSSYFKSSKRKPRIAVNKKHNFLKKISYETGITPTFLEMKRVLYRVSSVMVLQLCNHVCTRPVIRVGNPPASRDICAARRERAESRGISEKCAKYISFLSIY